MAHYAIGTSEGFQGVYEGDLLEEAVYEFLQNEGIRGISYNAEEGQMGGSLKKRLT